MSAQSQAANEDAVWFDPEVDDVRLSRSSRVITMIALALLCAGVWAAFARLDEVATGSGRVVPTSREQVIQSLEGGILAQLHVRQDDVVEPGQILAQLDPAQTRSAIEESAAKYRAALASANRLAAEVGGGELQFSAELADYPALVQSERDLFHQRRDALEDSLYWIGEALDQARQELEISERLASSGAVSTAEILRLKRQMADLRLQETEVRSTYMVEAREELARANADVQSLSSVIAGRGDTLERLTLRSPVRGVVKNIEVSTLGGVIAPNGVLMNIVPLDDQLLVEARLSPRDIAFIHPGQRATVKISAYDYAIYGGLEGEVATISPDTIADERDPDVTYYRVFVRTSADRLVNKQGQEFPILPGMVATADIHTGSKTVLDYLIKPLNKGREALRER